MREKAQKLNGLLITIYLLLLLAVLPLYMQDGLISIGSAKYYFFRDRTLLFVVLISVCSAFCFKAYKADQLKWSVLDIAVLSFAAASVLSFLCSNDKQTALWGFDGWYMGLISQLLFVWIYFAVSRWYDGEEYIWMIAEIAAGVVFLLGVLNRLNMDPLGIYSGMGYWDWNHHHLLSTIGNENWYCGYASVSAGICLYYGYAGKGITRAFGMIGSFLVFATMMTQGSETGYLVILVFLAILFLDSLKNRGKFIRFLMTALILPDCCLFFQFYLNLCQWGWNMEWNLDWDGSISGLQFFAGWPVIFALLFLFCLWEYLREKRGKRDYIEAGNVRKYVLCGIVVLTLLEIIVLILCQISDDFWEMLGSIELLRFSVSWGNYRGGLWYLSALGWLQSGIKDKLFGVGPDCFYLFFHQNSDVSEFLAETGMGETVYANAHNEWLNMLINEGLLGVVAYAAIFVCAFRRIWKNRAVNGVLLAALLALGGYMINGVFSFQQTVSTKWGLGVLGMAEAYIR
ncbi:MAG: O-antigen ligase family protein, partial [Lachnospiraceae bacterium]|nr:O-antigen ligase family protein [Lachnospiraceae bacterium]